MTHLLSEGKQNSHRGRATSLHRRQNSGIVDVQDVPPPEHIKTTKSSIYTLFGTFTQLKTYQINAIWYILTLTSGFDSRSFYFSRIRSGGRSPLSLLFVFSHLILVPAGLRPLALSSSCLSSALGSPWRLCPS